MEKYNEVNKKHYPEVYENKKVGVSKENVLKNSTLLHPRAETSENRISFVSRSKHNLAYTTKKHSSFGNEAKPHYKHKSEQHEMKRNTNLIVNAVSVDHNVTDRNLEHFRNFNGNLFNVHPTLCNLTCTVPEISHLNRVLNFQSSRHNELSFPKCAKHKQRAVFSERRMFNFKNTSSSDAFTSSKYSSATNCNTGYHCSKNSSWNAGNIDPYFNISPNEAVAESVTNDELNIKCGLKYCNTTVPKDCESITDLPILVHSNFSKQAWEVKYCLENKIRIGSKQRKWNSKHWDQVAMFPNKAAVDSRGFDKTDKVLFPALPSNSHSQVKLNSSHTSCSMPPSEHSSADNSDIESLHSLPDGNTASSFLTSVSSTIPQASYADVIRMPSAGVQNLIAADYEKSSDERLINAVVNFLPDKISKDENDQPGSSDWVISRLSQLDQDSEDIVHNVSLAQSIQNEQSNGIPRPIIVNLEKPSFYNSGLQGNKNILSTVSHNLISSDGQGLEDVRLITDYPCGLDKVLPDKVTLLSKSMQTACISDAPDKILSDTSIYKDSIYSCPSGINSLSDAFKPAEISVLKDSKNIKTNNPPVVIMNSSSLQKMSEISFGIEYDEMIKLCADVPDSSVKNDFSLRDDSIGCTSSSDSSKAHVQYETSHSTNLGQSFSTPDQYIKIKGKKMVWSDHDSHGKCNYQQMAEYFASVWKELEEGNEEGSKKKENLKYFEI